MGLFLIEYEGFGPETILGSFWSSGSFLLGIEKPKMAKMAIFG